MKKNKMLALLVALFAFGGANTSIAQYDDLYYNPDTDADYYNDNSSSSNDSYANNDDDYEYDDEEYDYEDNEYQYSSRIRRFHRPYYGFSYFDPVYVDRYYYDPFYFNDPFYYPGNTVLIYDSYYPGFRRNRWNWGWGWNSWSGSSFYVSYGNFYNPWRSGWYDPWYGGNTYIVNNYYGGGYNPYYGGGYYSNYYCPPSWGSGYTYNTVNNSNGSYYGSRRSGSTRPDNSPRRLTGPANDNPGANNADKQGTTQPREAADTARPSREAEDTRTNVRPGVSEPREGVRTTENATRQERATVTPPRTTESERNSTIDNSRRSRSNDRNNESIRNNSRSRDKGSFDNSRRNNNDRPSNGRLENNRSNNSRSRSGGIDNSRSNNSSRSGGFNSGSSNSNRSNRSSGSNLNSGSSRSNSSNSGSSSRSSSGSNNNSSRSKGGRGN